MWSAPKIDLRVATCLVLAFGRGFLVVAVFLGNSAGVAHAPGVVGLVEEILQRGLDDGGRVFGGRTARCETDGPDEESSGDFQG